MKTDARMSNNPSALPPSYPANCAGHAALTIVPQQMMDGKTLNLCRLLSNQDIVDFEVWIYGVIVDKFGVANCSSLLQRDFCSIFKNDYRAIRARGAA